MSGARALRPVVVAVVVGAVVTALLAASPAQPFAYYAPSLHVAIETASGLAALLAAYLVYGRFRHSGGLPELALAVAFAILGLANLVLFAMPTAIGGARPGTTLLWVGLVARLAGSAALAAAAVAPAVRLRQPVTAGRIALAGVLTALLGLGVGLALLGLDPPGGLSPLLGDGQALEHVVGIPGLKLLGTVLFAASAAGFARRAVRSGDELYAWLATGAVLAAFARLNYVLAPSVYSDWVYPADALRLGFYGVVLFASAREIRRYWQRIAEAEVVEERRRLARELHDGVAQELAFIGRRARVGGGGLDAATVREIAAAADRGRSEARRAVSALTGRGDEPFDVALGQAVEHVAARAGAQVRCTVTITSPPPAAAREHLIRIACEAVSNAVRHSAARAILVEVTDDGGLRLRVTDDGLGFEPADATAGGGGGFGLRIMQERAERLGAELELRSRPGAGTEVLVVVP